MSWNLEISSKGENIKKLKKNYHVGKYEVQIYEIGKYHALVLVKVVWFSRVCLMTLYLNG